MIIKKLDFNRYLIKYLILLIVEMLSLNLKIIYRRQRKLFVIIKLILYLRYAHFLIFLRNIMIWRVNKLQEKLLVIRIIKLINLIKAELLVSEVLDIHQLHYSHKIPFIFLIPRRQLIVIMILIAELEPILLNLQVKVNLIQIFKCWKCLEKEHIVKCFWSEKEIPVTYLLWKLCKFKTSINREWKLSKNNKRYTEVLAVPSMWNSTILSDKTTYIFLS